MLLLLSAGGFQSMNPVPVQVQTISAADNFLIRFCRLCELKNAKQLLLQFAVKMSKTKTKKASRFWLLVYMFLL
jgi:hypothetical protein